MTATHVGRSWPGVTRIEDDCPCPQEPCGLVDPMRADPDCEHHPLWRAKSFRQSHTADACPGPRPAREPEPKRRRYRFLLELPEPEPRRAPTTEAEREFADACRAHPGEWTVWPPEFGEGSQLGTDIARGVRSAFPARQFETAVRNRVRYIRFVGRVPSH